LSNLLFSPLPFLPMRTLLPDPPPAELQAMLERRKCLGQDRRDEVWEGVLHMVPAPPGEHADITQQLAELLGRAARTAGLFPTMSGFNVGEANTDFRIPDGGLHRSRPRVSGLQPPRLCSRSFPPTTRPGKSSPSTPPTT
jgi:hypothetical protein